MSDVSRAFRLARRPVGLPTRDDWEFTEDPVGEPEDGEIVVDVLYISLDPAMRGWMNDSRSYIRAVEIGDVMRALAVGRVAASKHPDVAVGDHVTGLFGVQSRVRVHGAAVGRADPEIAPLPVWLGPLGMPGMTAYFGLVHIGQPQEGQTVVVSGAGGAVGQLVGQIAKLKGARAVGIAGGPGKCARVMDEFGFDATIDYKSEDVATGLATHCPDGIDVYFDNVGGDILDAALAKLAREARVVICGAISQYNTTGPVQGPANYLALLVNHATMTGFVVSDFGAHYAEGAREMGQWIASGQIKSREHVVSGIEHFPETLLKLFTGDNDGKLVLAVDAAAE